MILKSNEKTDINMSELTVEIDAESLKRLWRLLISMKRKIYHCLASVRARFREKCVKMHLVKTYSMSRL